MKYEILERQAKAQGATPLQAYLNRHESTFVLERGETTYTFLLKEKTSLYKDIFKCSWDDSGDLLFCESCLFFDGSYSECGGHSPAGTSKQLEKLSKWVKSL